MEKSIFLAGSGGHGIQVAGKILVTAENTDTQNATYSPRYGVEKRGGLSSCYIVLSSGKIGNPRKDRSDIVVLMEPKCYAQFKDSVKEGGCLIINSSLIRPEDETADSIRRIPLPISDTVAELGNPKVISTVLIGILAGIPGLFEDTERIKDSMLSLLAKKPELLELNKKAYEIGKDLAAEYFNR